MGLVVIGMCMYLSLIVVLLVFLIVYLLINTKKNGFRKTIKSLPSIAAISTLLLLGGMFILAFIPASSRQLFRKYLLKPVPESVKILQSYDGSPDFYPDECLHFKISPADLQLILAAKEWQNSPDIQLGDFQCGGYEEQWDFSFSPQDTGNNVSTYTFVPLENDIEVMFVNSETNEVYFIYHDGNMP
ncbi:MAG: hypothetical protein VB013_04705 [Anaerolineaceae bacterium]|nr:hypothetical protein [Anaerolineaceae bacterium]